MGTSSTLEIARFCIIGCFNCLILCSCCVVYYSLFDVTVLLGNLRNKKEEKYLEDLQIYSFILFPYLEYRINGYQLIRNKWIETDPNPMMTTLTLDRNLTHKMRGWSCRIHLFHEVQARLLFFHYDTVMLLAHKKFIYFFSSCCVVYLYSRKCVEESP